MATIEPYATAKGRRYQVRYRTPQGKQTKRRGFATKRAAESFASTVEVQKLRGDYVDFAATQVRIGELGGPWLERQHGHLKASTFRPLESAWRVHVEPRWGAIKVGDIRFSDVQSWIAGMARRRSSTTVKRCLGVLSAILADAVRDRRLTSNPCAGIKTPRRTPRPRTYLSHQQVAALASEAGVFEPLVLTLAYTGLRWGEVAGLRVRDVDFSRRRLQVERNAVEVGWEIIVGTPKTHERRSVPFPRLLDVHLRRQVDDKPPDALLFTSRDGGFLRRTRSDDASAGWFSGAVRRSEVPRLTPHDLRHTAASLAISAGANVKVVQRMLGHKSAAMTLDVYADLFDDDLDSVALALDDAATASRTLRAVWSQDVTVDVPHHTAADELCPKCAREGPPDEIDPR